ncbi:MAG: Na+/H+ antiporter NhaA [Pseudomonadota bacterium]
MSSTRVEHTGPLSGFYRVWSFLTEYSVLLIIGALLALIWANIDFHSYHHAIEYNLLTNDYVGHLHDGHRELTIHYLINDVLMALFFAIAGKEVWEAVALKNGSLRGKKALTPLIATVGGMAGPIGVYLLVAYAASAAGAMAFNQLLNGWAVPTATDIAFSYLVGRLVFGAGHPAVRFLLLLAIADDAAGLIILAIFYPQGELAPEWLALSFGAALLVYLLFNWGPRRLDAAKEDRITASMIRRRFGVWPYVIGGALSWYGFQQAGIHPALGLLPIIPAIPHEDVALGFFAEAEKYSTDMLNQLEHALKTPVEIVLFLFGLANAGVALSSVNAATYAVLAGLLIGKPLGIWAFGAFAAHGLRLGLPAGMRTSDLFVLGCVAAIGFTVALFIAAVAFPSGAVQDGAKMGALLSFFASVMSFAAGWAFRVQKVPAP